MRWWVALSTRIRAHGFAQLKSGVCMFTKYDSRGLIASYLVCHAGDILFYGADGDLDLIGKALRTFRAGDAERLGYMTPIAPDGVLIGKSIDSSISFSKTQSTQETRKINADDHFADNQIARPKKLRTAPRQAMESLIWLHQTRPDAGYEITKPANDAVEAFTDPNMARLTINLYDENVRFAQTYQRGSVYTNPPGDESREKNRIRSFAQRRLVVFADARFGSLAASN